MAKEKFAVAIDEEVMQELDELVAECGDPGSNRSKIAEPILTAFVQSQLKHAERVREVIIRK